MELHSDCNRLMSDQDVVALVQEEFQRQIFAENRKSGLSKKTSISMDLWDSLWKPIAPVVNPKMNPSDHPIFDQVANPVFCLACDTMFNCRLALEQHACPFVSFICSCGISFGKYPDMWSHSISHNHKATYVVNHKSAIQSRIISVKEQESKLRILEATAKNVGIVPNTATPTPVPSSWARCKSGKTLNLWRRFKPVVKLDTLQSFEHQKKYVCAICREGMCKQDVLIKHVAAAHSDTCLYGCSRCGLILISTVPPKPQHRCGSFYSNNYKKFTIGKVLRDPLAADWLYMPYGCKYCTLKFSHPVHLSNHVRFNHTNISKLQEAPTNKARKSRANREQHASASMPNGAAQIQKLRCALCGIRNDSIKMLAEHRCTRKLASLKPETGARPFPEKTPQRLELAESSSSEVTFRFQDISNIKTHGHTKLLTIKSEPVEVNLKMTQDFSHRVSVKTEPELLDHDNGLEKASDEINGLFYQKCSAPNANNLKYFLSNI